MNFLVIRFSSLGDIITTTAFLRALKDKYPKSNIYYATKVEFEEILKHQPFIDYVFGLKKGESLKSFSKNFSGIKFECVYDLHKNLRSISLSYMVKKNSIKRVNKHTLYRHKLIHRRLLFFVKDRDTEYNIDDQIKLIGSDFKDRKPVLYVKKAKIETKKPLIGLAPGAKWQTKMWPAEYFRKLIGIITKQIDCDIAIFGSEGESEIANKIKNGYKNIVDFTGKLSVNKTAEYMANCSVVISNDSALMHMAVALDIPVVAIFGPTVKEFGFFPKGRGVVLEDNSLNCRPCSLHGSNACPKKNHRCMKDITPAQVFNAVKKLLEDNKNEQ